VLICEEDLILGMNFHGFSEAFYKVQNRQNEMKDKAICHRNWSANFIAEIIDPSKKFLLPSIPIPLAQIKCGKKGIIHGCHWTIIIHSHDNWKFYKTHTLHLLSVLQFISLSIAFGFGLASSL
jgi:hypothetical protein